LSAGLLFFVLLFFCFSAFLLLCFSFFLPLRFFVCFSAFLASLLFCFYVFFVFCFSVFCSMPCICFAFVSFLFSTCFLVVLLDDKFSYNCMKNSTSSTNNKSSKYKGATRTTNATKETRTTRTRTAKERRTITAAKGEAVSVFLGGSHC